MGGSGYFGAFFTVGEAQGEVSKAIAGAGSIGGGCMALCLFRSRPTPLPLRSLPLRSLMRGTVRAERDSLVEGWRSQGAGAGEPEGGGRRRKKSEEFVGQGWLPFFQKPRLPFFSLICRHFSLHFLSPVPPSPLETLEKKTQNIKPNKPKCLSTPSSAGPPRSRPPEPPSPPTRPRGSSPPRGPGRNSPPWRRRARRRRERRRRRRPLPPPTLPPSSSSSRRRLLPPLIPTLFPPCSCRGLTSPILTLVREEKLLSQRARERQSQSRFRRQRERERESPSSLGRGALSASTLTIAHAHPPLSSPLPQKK